ncbi:hypothetical protein B7463_g6770, partial [Scytalidium lignicola]
MLIITSIQNPDYPFLPESSQDGRKDLLHQLPNELLLNILKKCPDFSCLWNLINTSPRLLSIFNRCAPEIIEAILCSTISASTEPLMRAVIGIRSRSFECRTWTEAKNLSLATQSPTRTLRFSNPPIPAAVLRKFVLLAHNIHVLTHVCIERCLQRFLSTTANPAPVAAAEAAAACSDPWHEDGADTDTRIIRKAEFPDQRPRFQDLAPPSWINEQRTLCTVWQIKYFYELKVGRLKGRLHWSAWDLSSLQFATIPSFYSGFERLQVLAALDVIDELRMMNGVVEKSAEFESESEYGSTSHSFAWSRSPVPFQLPRVVRVSRVTLTCCGSGGGDWGVEQCGEKRESLREDTAAWRYSQGGDVRGGGQRPLRCQSMDAFGRFGYFLWDRRTIAGLRLWSEGNSVDVKNLTRHFLHWSSILSDEVGGIRAD